MTEGVWLSTNNPDTSLQAMIYLINRSDEPVFVLALEHRERLIMETPDEAYEARVRGAHEAASYLVRPGSGEMFALSWEALKDLDHGLKEVNPPTFEARPEGVTPPEEQHSELLMVYGEQVVLLPFTISYAINENFMIEEYLGPAGVAEPTVPAAADRGLGDQGTIILVLAGLGAAVLIAWWMWRRQRRN
jgi:LPXTG-motif cell wall-anchored protein